jgi:predicted glycosyltransferase
LVVAAGGGGDGGEVFRLGADLIRCRPDWHGTLVAGPYATDVRGIASGSGATDRLMVVRGAANCLPFFAAAGAVLQMAGYNSTVESLAVGIRPILVPRRSPRREQAIRASRLASLGLADVVDQGAQAAEVDWLLDRPRGQPPGAIEQAGLSLHGAANAARELLALAEVKAG